jgi:hypothetical protein
VIHVQHCSHYLPIIRAFNPKAKIFGNRPVMAALHWGGVSGWQAPVQATVFGRVLETVRCRGLESSPARNGGVVERRAEAGDCCREPGAGSGGHRDRPAGGYLSRPDLSLAA